MMALVGRREGRNFGYGRQLSYAGPQALKDLFAGGHFATVKAHSDRWQAFVRWCRSEDGPGFNDARQIDRQTLHEYAAYLRQQIQQGELCIATAQNRLSSVNRTLAALRGDQDVRIANPSQALGQQRSSVRTRAPDGQDHQQVRRVLEALGERHHERVAAIVRLARATGMRLREAILADLPRLQREAEHLGRINIQDGTKGGRSGASAPRWIAANEEVKTALQLARHAAPAGSRNLLARDESYALFLQRTVLPAREMLHEQGLRAFMNCERPTPARVTNSSRAMPHPSMAATAIALTVTWINRRGNRSALSSDITELMWFRPTLEVERDQAL